VKSTISTRVSTTPLTPIHAKASASKSVATGPGSDPKADRFKGIRDGFKRLGEWIGKHTDPDQISQKRAASEAKKLVAQLSKPNDEVDDLKVASSLSRLIKEAGKQKGADEDVVDVAFRFFAGQEASLPDCDVTNLKNKIAARAEKFRRLCDKLGECGFLGDEFKKTSTATNEGNGPPTNEVRLLEKLVSSKRLAQSDSQESLGEPGGQNAMRVRWNTAARLGAEAAMHIGKAPDYVKDALRAIATQEDAVERVRQRTDQPGKAETRRWPISLEKVQGQLDDAYHHAQECLEEWGKTLAAGDLKTAADVSIDRFANGLKQLPDAERRKVLRDLDSLLDVNEAELDKAKEKMNAYISKLGPNATPEQRERAAAVGLIAHHILELAEPWMATFSEKQKPGLVTRFDDLMGSLFMPGGEYVNLPLDVAHRALIASPDLSQLTAKLAKTEDDPNEYRSGFIKALTRARVHDMAQSEKENAVRDFICFKAKNTSEEDLQAFLRNDTSGDRTNRQEDLTVKFLAIWRNAFDSHFKSPISDAVGILMDMKEPFDIGTNPRASVRAVDRIMTLLLGGSDEMAIDKAVKRLPIEARKIAAAGHLGIRMGTFTEAADYDDKVAKLEKKFGTQLALRVLTPPFAVAGDDGVLRFSKLFEWIANDVPAKIQDPKTKDWSVCTDKEVIECVKKWREAYKIFVTRMAE